MLMRVELWFVDPSYPDFLLLKAAGPYNDSHSGFRYFPSISSYLLLTAR